MENRISKIVCQLVDFSIQRADLCADTEANPKEIMLAVGEIRGMNYAVSMLLNEFSEEGIFTEETKPVVIEERPENFIGRNVVITENIKGKKGEIILHEGSICKVSKVPVLHNKKYVWTVETVDGKYFEIELNQFRWLQ